MKSSENTEVREWSFGRVAHCPPGPWTGEPDKAQWVDAATGLDCLIVRNRLGALCGYVGVPPTHPWHGKGYNQCLDGCDAEWCWEHASPDSRVEVHGGLTFAAACQENAGDDAICHVPFPGREADVWWFGFDCLHAGDMSPSDAQRAVENRHQYPWNLDSSEVYRPVGYVKEQCAQLASQLVAVSS